MLMANQNSLQNIFSSNFYIDTQYGQSFAPLLYQIMTGNSIQNQHSEAELMDKAQHNLSVGESDSEKYVAIVTIKQPIIKYSYYGYLGSKSYQRILSSFASDPNVLGVVLDIDSGGGQSYGTAEFYDFIQNYSKPIVTYTDGLLCSAAYYIGAASSSIIANSRSENIGSIGAYSSMVDFTGIIEKLGGKVHEFYATESTEKNSEWREAMKGNYEPYIKNVLDPLVKTFQTDMKKARPQLDEKVFKGGTWGAEESLKLGLIDEIGTLESAVSKVIEMANQSSNSNQLNNPDMSQETVTLVALAAVLGVEKVDAKKANIFSAEETVSLNIDQLQKIEDALNAKTPDEALKTQISELKTELETSKSETTAEKQKVTDLNAAVDTAIATAGLTAEKKTTTAENIALLSEKVVEYGGKDGAAPTNVHSDADANAPEAESTSIFDSYFN